MIEIEWDDYLAWGLAIVIGLVFVGIMWFVPTWKDSKFFTFPVKVIMTILLFPISYAMIKMKG